MPGSVLVVDDDRLIQTLVQRSLRDQPGLGRVQAAGSVAAARQVLDQDDVSCVVLDLSLPDGDGRSLLAQIDRMGACAPATVVMTGQPTEAVASELLTLGVDDCLSKADVGPAALRRAVRCALDRHAVRQELCRRADAWASVALRDPLTELLNRRGLEAALAEHSGPVVAILVDLDDFKAINTRFGHHVGDRVLKAAADVLSGATRPADLVARLGGDELVVVCPEDSLEAAAALAERLCVAVSEAMSAVLGVEAGAGPSPRLTATLGVAGVGAGASATDVFRACTHAVCRAKQDGKARVHVVSRDCDKVEPPRDSVVARPVGEAWLLSGLDRCTRSDPTRLASVVAIARSHGLTGRLLLDCAPEPDGVDVPALFDGVALSGVGRGALSVSSLVAAPPEVLVLDATVDWSSTPAARLRLDRLCKIASALGILVAAEPALVLPDGLDVVRTGPPEALVAASVGAPSGAL